MGEVMLLRSLATYVPPALVRAALTEPSPTVPVDAQSERFPAAVLFADISGFTPLTEALAQRGAEGPEELTRLLNSYFSRMIALVEAQGGEVVKFSGDALMVIFPALQDDLGIVTRRGAQAASAMQAAMDKFATLETSVGPVALGMKIGLGAGDVLAAQVGGVNDRWEYVIAGDPLRQVAQAEHQAERGEIVLSPEAEAVIVLHNVSPRPLPQPDWDAVQDQATVEARLRFYIPKVVTSWLEQELHAWLAVLRPMSVLFIGIAGLDYAQSDSVDRLHAFVCAAQEIVQRHEGTINKLAVDDKGTILLVLFGAPPRAHEDDPERALRCAMALQGAASPRGLQLAIGATTGRVFAGPVGGETRHEYTVMGDTVNLAARLMGAAGRNEIYCDYKTYLNAHHKLAFDLLPPMRVKGKAGLIRIYRPTGETDEERMLEPGRVLVGRRDELARLTTLLEELQAGHGRVLLIEGEAGIGKSRLVEELAGMIPERGIAGLMGMGYSIEQQTPYRAWREVFVSFFDLDDVGNVLERQHLVQAYVRDVAPDLMERLPLLNDVLNLGFPENELTASLDTDLRHESLVSLLLTLLRTWAAESPLMLVLEDAHWLDTLSWDLTVQVARMLTVARVPLLLVVVMRPLEGNVIRLEPQALAKMEGAERLVLDVLSAEEILALVAGRLGLDEGDLPSAVAELVATRAVGNPFFAEELVYALRDHGLIAVETRDGRNHCVVSRDLKQASGILPSTIQGIVLSRIDRLPPDEQLALKVAAVIGRTFAYTTLHDTLGEHLELTDRLLRTSLENLAELDLTPLDAPEPELTYIFKHIITQNVAYETLLFAQRRQLHRSVARWYERTYGSGVDHPKETIKKFAQRPVPGAEELESPLAPYYPLLAYHWRQAEDQDRERHYARLAGQWAAAQFANVEAAGYFSRALELTSEDDLVARYDLLMAREAVNNLLGEREAQLHDLNAVLSLVKTLNDNQRGAQVALRMANYAEVTSDYPAALTAVQEAIEQARRVQDRTSEIEGHIAWGKVLWRQGDYDAARARLEQALSMARSANRRLNQAQGLGYLGHVCLYQGHYPAAQKHYRQALELYRAEHHRQGEADNLINLGSTYDELGNYPAACDHYEQALSVFQTIGDRRGMTMALNNLGVAYCDQGGHEAARDYHQRALELRLTIGDRYGEAASLVNLGLVYYALGDDEAAREHCQRSLAIQREIGDQRGQGYSLTYLGHALGELGELVAAASSYDEAIQLRRDLGQDSLAIDDLAGLARVRLAQGHLDQALDHVEKVLHWIEVNGTEGIEYPLQVYLSCYRVLSAAAPDDHASAERAYVVLSDAHAELMKRAAGIHDDILRRQFLENIAVHREITAAWERR